MLKKSVFLISSLVFISLAVYFVRNFETLALKNRELNLYLKDKIKPKKKLNEISTILEQSPEKKIRFSQGEAKSKYQEFSEDAQVLSQKFIKSQRDNTQFYKERKFFGKRDNDYFKTLDVVRRNFSKKPQCVYYSHKSTYFCCDFGYLGCYFSKEGKKVTGEKRQSLFEKTQHDANGDLAYALTHEYDGCEISADTNQIGCKSLVKGISSRGDYNPAGMLQRQCFNRDEECEDFNIGCTKFSQKMHTDDNLTSVDDKRWVCCKVNEKKFLKCSIYLAYKEMP